MMIFFMVIVTLILVIIIAAKEREIDISDFEINRRIKNNDPRASKLLLKKQLIPAWNRILDYLARFLFICLILLLGREFIFWQSLIIGLVLVCVIFVLAKSPTIKRPILINIHKYSTKFYRFFSILGKRTQAKIIKFGRPKKVNLTIYSTDELLYLAEKSPNVISQNQINWFNKIIKLDSHIEKFMTPIDDLKILDEKELLTPIVIDELYKSGQKKFIVMNKKSKVLGVLELEKITDLTNKTSQIARNMMNKDFSVVNQDRHSLEVFEDFITNSKQFIIVENLDGEIVGAVEIDDFLK